MLDNNTKSNTILIIKFMQQYDNQNICHYNLFSYLQE